MILPLGQWFCPHHPGGFLSLAIANLFSVLHGSLTVFLPLLVLRYLINASRVVILAFLGSLELSCLWIGDYARQGYVWALGIHVVLVYT